MGRLNLNIYKGEPLGKPELSGASLRFESATITSSEARGEELISVAWGFCLLIWAGGIIPFCIIQKGKHAHRITPFVQGWYTYIYFVDSIKLSLVAVIRCKWKGNDIDHE